MNRRGVKHRVHQLAIDITPMVDVVFLLIIFFMTTAQFARLTRSEVDLPLEPGEQDRTRVEAGLVINLTRQGQIIVASKTVDLNELQQMVQDEIRLTADQDPMRLKLLLRADKAADTAVMNRVVSMLQGMGVGQTRFGTEIPPGAVR